MIRVRKGADRGHFDHGWLDTYHTFSFSGYYDPAHRGFRALRVINEDTIAAGRGFGTHPHEDMEIITYVLEGGLAHRDSLGTGSVIRPGEMQHMTAGTGIQHSEYNASETEQVHLYQIWLFPDQRGLEPSYDQKSFPAAERVNTLRLVASPDGDEEALHINQNARLYLGALEEGKAFAHRLAPGRYAWLQVLRGAVDFNGHTLSAGDGAAVSDESKLTIEANATSEVMLFDLS